MLFDTHCHLDTELFDADRDDVFARAYAAGVTQFLNPAYDLASSRRAAQLANGRADVVAAVGLHPNDIGHLDDACMSQLETLAATERVVAIGEIGLDYHWDTHPRPLQRAGFVRQFALAQRLQLPVIIHCRDAYDDLMETLAEIDVGTTAQPRVPVLLHSFAGKPAHARAAIAQGYFLGIGGPLTYKNAHTLRDVVQSVPLTQLVLETDAPYLPPIPHRGQRNEPAYMRLVAEHLATLLHMPLDELAQVTTANAKRLFKVV